MRFIAFSSKTKRSMMYDVGVPSYYCGHFRLVRSNDYRWPSRHEETVVVRRDPLSIYGMDKRGGSSADRTSMLQMNETNWRKNALKKSMVLLQDYTNQWRAVATKQIIFVLSQIVNLIFWLLSTLDPDRLFGQLLARRNSCSSKIIIPVTLTYQSY